MSKHPRILLEHILESISLIEQYVGQMSRNEFIRSPQVQDAVIRRLQIIGEAVKSLRDDLWSRYPGLPWRQIAGMRDVLIHKYFAVDLILVWNVIRRDLPALKATLEEILPRLE